MASAETGALTVFGFTRWIIEDSISTNRRLRSGETRIEFTYYGNGPSESGSPNESGLSGCPGTTTTFAVCNPTRNYKEQL